MKKVKKHFVFLKDEKSNLVEVEKDVIEGRFKIIDELREENKSLKCNNKIVSEYKEKKSDFEELESIFQYVDFIHYTVKANNIKLGVSIRLADNNIDRYGTLYRLSEDHEYDREIFKTDNKTFLEDCVEEINEFITVNFKTDLD